MFSNEYNRTMKNEFKIIIATNLTENKRSQGLLSMGANNRYLDIPYELDNKLKEKDTSGHASPKVENFV